ncbi:hypothetical protein [Burkholderia cenocepacia]|uniref:hypothetical protein n=1 Tax=Burkholderia cenocepacia TaxID=95486 RepID=UPI0022327695|nr:hypothetical protein [Burkholderia cenocepacia]MCW3609108.1 hypothetical protein [Burkholderia cenocepacia]MCW5189942.1 hypothetical protein [Burkholderia cenocepacia]
MGWLFCFRSSCLRAEILLTAERGINGALERGKAGREWGLEPQKDELVATLIAWHDDQLRTAPLDMFAEVLERALLRNSSVRAA